ncbi:unnamed protein product [Symbiodinium pilosum]|uniref:Uncharacterized protein n=1 Tax=Symbiodinium pilosum TaxID=2952 RepID=A0A812LRI8_SYMPI|nr:unnamed protein product [Symbiodinium pilosum]
MSTLGSRKMQVLEHEYVLLTLFHQSQSKLTRNILSEKTAETLHRDNDSMPPVPGASCLFMSSCPSQSLVAKERELGNLRKVDREDLRSENARLLNQLAKARNTVTTLRKQLEESNAARDRERLRAESLQNVARELQRRLEEECAKANVLQKTIANAISTSAGSKQADTNDSRAASIVQIQGVTARVVAMSLPAQADERAGADDEAEDVGHLEAALDEMLRDADASQGDFYDLVARLPLHCWACEWISPKPGVLQSCSLVPKIGAMGLLGSRLKALGAEVVLSVGSGSGLIEWLLSPRFPVVCVDYYYRPSATGDVDSWVLAPLHDDLRRSWNEDDTRLSFVKPGDDSALQKVLNSRRTAALFVWPQLDLTSLQSYALAVGSSLCGMVFVVGENCSPSPVAAAAAFNCDVGESEEVVSRRICMIVFNKFTAETVMITNAGMAFLRKLLPFFAGSLPHAALSADEFRHDGDLR